MNHSRERNAILNCDWSLRYCLVVLRPNPEGFLCELERIEKERVWKDVFRNCVSQAHAQRRALRVERTFMAREYGSTSRKDAMTPFSMSSAIARRS